MRARVPLLALRCVQQCSPLGNTWSQILPTCAVMTLNPAVHSFGSVDTAHSPAIALTAEALPAALIRSFACSGMLIHSSEGDDDGI